MKNIITQLNTIQGVLNAPKNQRNNFGGYNYRSCEDILEAVKPLLSKTCTVLTVSDEMVEVGGRIYVKATATITDGEESISNTAFAREAEAKKGMDEAQITGSASSYARKYALNGLFCIDDNKDPDATNTHGKDEKKPAEKASETLEKTKTEKEKVLEKAREIGKEISKMTSIPLSDFATRTRTESTIALMRSFKLNSEADWLEGLYNNKAEQDSLPQ